MYTLTKGVDPKLLVKYKLQKKYRIYSVNQVECILYQLKSFKYRNMYNLFFVEVIHCKSKAMKC